MFKNDKKAWKFKMVQRDDDLGREMTTSTRTGNRN